MMRSNRFARSSVIQFCAATPDLPGIANAIVSRSLDDKIRITTNRGEFAVKPAANFVERSIDPQAANFAC
jgi:hypothetical protein